MIELGSYPGTGTSVLRNRHFMFLWIAQALSQTAQNAVFYALLVLVEQRTGSSTQVGLYILSAIVPSVLFGIGAGVLVDRLPKRVVLVVTNLLRVPVVLAYLAVGGVFSLVYLLNFVFSTIAQFFAPAEAAAIPLLVRRAQLISANGLFHLTFVSSQMAGFVVLAPPIVKLFGVEALLVVVAAIYLVAALLVSLLPSQEPAHSSLETVSGARLLQGLLDELKEGWYLITRDRPIALAMLQLTVMATLMLVMGMLAPGFASRVLGVPAADAAYILSPAGVGLVAGAIVVPRLAPRLGKERSANAGLLILSGAFLLLGLASPIKRSVGPQMAALLPPLPLSEVSGLVAVVMVLALVIGWAFTLVVIPAQTILQERAPTHMRGRVFAVQITFGNAASLLPLLFLGALADLVGITVVIVLNAALLLAISLYSLARTRRAHAAEPPGAEIAGEAGRLPPSQSSERKE